MSHPEIPIPGVTSEYGLVESHGTPDSLIHTELWDSAVTWNYPELQVPRVNGNPGSLPGIWDLRINAEHRVHGVPGTPVFRVIAENRSSRDSGNSEFWVTPDSQVSQGNHFPSRFVNRSSWNSGYPELGRFRESEFAFCMYLLFLTNPRTQRSG